MSNVVPIKVPPKTIKRCYKGVNFVVTFIPATKKWRWEITKTVATTYSEEADTQREAIRAAERMIDAIS